MPQPAWAGIQQCIALRAEFHVMLMTTLDVLYGHMMSEVQERYGLRHIICWHSLYGYWAGIAPDAPDIKPLMPSLIMPEPSSGLWPPWAYVCNLVLQGGHHSSCEPVDVGGHLQDRWQGY